MDVQILGTLEVEEASRAVAVRGRRQRSLLALLLLCRNEVVSSDRLREELWGLRGSGSSQNALQAAVSRLRRALPADRLVTQPPGYLLRIRPGELDAVRFEQLLEDGRAALAEGDAEAAAELLADGLSLWRGSALADFTYEPFAQGEIARLEELRLEAREDRFEAELALGRQADVVAGLEALVEEHPLRERPRGQLMLALYRSGRQTEALDVYRATRRMLLDELGLEPGPELRRLERRILAQDPDLDVEARPRAGAARGAAPDTRRIVTVLACGLADAPGPVESLDAERLRELVERCAAAAAQAVSAHAGTLVESLGDPLAAVFGVPTLHEDDALRAVRAALDLRDRIAGLDRELDVSFGVRIGIATGEVVTGEARAGQPPVTGAAVTSAARLGRLAAAGEIVVDEATYRLVSGVARVEARADAAGRGESERAPAWRLLGLVPETVPFRRRLETPLAGRRDELAELQAAFVRTVEERTPRLLTVVGPPGIGKSRLARELAARLPDEATVLAGRCRPYGEGITFWPLREILFQTPDGELRTQVSALLHEDGASVPTVAAAVTADEIFLAVRRLLESLSRERPLLVVLEDLHWADPTFLDFVERLGGLGRDTPMLLLCLARSELLELREGWGKRMERASVLPLEPLSDEETDALLDALGTGPEVRARVTEVAEGNPLFAEQLAAWLGEGGGADRDRGLPPTVQALLAARLDRLGPAEAAVLQRAALIGRDFDAEAILELLPADARLSASRHLDALVRKGLVEPLMLLAEGSQGFRFVHALVRDAAYRMVPKRLRADLHERFAHWLEQAGGRHEEADELLGYHLEQAHRWLAELGPPTERSRQLAEQAAARLAVSGRRAFSRSDIPGAVTLLERSAVLLPRDDVRRLRMLPLLGRALVERGQLERAERVLSEAIESGHAAGERGVAADATVARTFLRLHTDPDSRHETVRRDLQDPIRVFEELHDESGLARALGLAGILRLWDGQAAAAVEELERAARHAAAASDRAQEVENLRYLLIAVLYGPTPVPSALQHVNVIARRERTHPKLEMKILHVRAHLTAMQGHFDAARALIAQAQRAAEELGLELDVAASIRRSACEIELLAGEPVAAEEAIRPGCDALERMGIWTHLPSVVPGLADALYAQGRYTEATPLIELATRWLVGEDVEAQIGLQRVQAKLLAHQGDLHEAERLARAAVDLAARTDLLDWRAKAQADLADILRLAGRPDEAAGALEQATVLYQLKGNKTAAAQHRTARTDPATEG